MDTIFMSSGNSKTSESHILLLDLLDSINLKRSDKNVASSMQHGCIALICLLGHIIVWGYWNIFEWNIVWFFGFKNLNQFSIKNYT